MTRRPRYRRTPLFYLRNLRREKLLAHPIRQTAALLTAGILALSSPIDVFAAEKLTRLSDGTYSLFSEGENISGVVHRGIDVSHWQGSIDWEKAKADDVDFVMLGTRYSGAVDPLFSQNAENAAAAGVNLGAYIYSYATSIEEAEQEADFVLELVKNYPISYPIAFDIENAETSGLLSKEELTEVVKAFCEKIRDAGYYPILYANDYWLNNKLDMTALKDYPVWIAAYERNYNYTTSSPVMWQATDSGSVDGVSGGVDIDLQFTDFSDQIPADSWKKFDGIWYFYENYRKVADKLIYDGSNYYYMQKDGTIYYGGWMTLDGLKRYFDPDSGIMRRGWKKIGDSWYHFADNGGMETGWISDQGLWYYTGLTGIMMTGWVRVNNLWYYLDASGAMQTGMQEIGGARYYLGSSGAMETGWVFDQGNWYYMSASGSMEKGWINLGGTWYYLGDDGVMRTGVQNVDGVSYYFGTDGAMYHDTTAEVNGKLYSFSSGGVMTEASEAASADGTASSDSAASGSASAESASSGTVSSDAASSDAASSGDEITQVSAPSNVTSSDTSASGIISAPAVSDSGTASGSSGGAASSAASGSSSTSGGVVQPAGS